MHRDRMLRAVSANQPLLHPTPHPIPTPTPTRIRIRIRTPHPPPNRNWVINAPYVSCCAVLAVADAPIDSFGLVVSVYPIPQNGLSPVQWSTCRTMQDCQSRHGTNWVNI